jgi:hypothetical protein
MITQVEYAEQTSPTAFTSFAEITPFGEELPIDVLDMIAGGQRCNCCGSSKVCDVGGGCWADTDF